MRASTEEPRSLTLLEIADTITAGFTAIDEAETDEEREALQSAVSQAVTNDLPAKVDGIGWWLDRNTSEVEDLRKLRLLVDEKIEAKKRRGQRFREMIREAMQRLQTRKLAGKVRTISLRAGSPSLVIVDESRIPVSYKTVMTTVVVNNVAVKKALVAGEEVPGATLKFGEDSVTIR
jgi:hypothetical protein